MRVEEINSGLQETVTDFILGASKITADGDCSHEIKRHLLLASYDQPRQHTKFRDITLPTKARLVKDMVYSRSYVWM